MKPYDQCILSSWNLQKYADIIVPEGGMNRIAIDTIVSKINKFYKKVRNNEKYIITLIGTLIFCTAVLYATDMTVYNQNFATVRSELSIVLQKGLNLYSFDDIPAAIQPTSVHLEPVKSSDTVVIMLQNFEYDLANTNKILDKYLDKTITLITISGELFSGILKSFDYDTIVIQNSNGGINMVNRDEVQNIDLEKMPENFFTKPTLNWELLSNKSGDTPCKLSYITNNISWDAQYVGILDNDDKHLNLSSWISLKNNSGKAFKDVTLKLMAGDVNLAPVSPTMQREMAMKADGFLDYEQPQITEKGILRISSLYSGKQNCGY